MREALIAAILVIGMFGFAVSQDTIITGGEDGQMFPDENKTQVSSHLPSQGKYSYGPDKALDWEDGTAWCVKGKGKGEWIKYFMKPGRSEVYLILKGKRNIYRVGFLNGLGASKELYFANNRVKTMRAEFSEGEKRTFTLKDGVLDLQYIKFDIRSKWVKFTILEVYPGNKYNDTCISEIDFRDTYDLSDEEYKRMIRLKKELDID
jgi:hypothetical protein